MRHILAMIIGKVRIEEPNLTLRMCLYRKPNLAFGICLYRKPNLTLGICLYRKPNPAYGVCLHRENESGTWSVSVQGKFWRGGWVCIV